jgi:hypothetical protein
MEDAALPQVAAIVGAVKETLGSHG